MNARLLMAHDDEHNFRWLDKLLGQDYYVDISLFPISILFVSTEVYSRTSVHIARAGR
ncbi:uncharacterized protein J3R85_008508 [Psidium guajava]|nr:uncharacterized protein J3R85_008508 [Psidium guajava]